MTSLHFMRKFTPVLVPTILFGGLYVNDNYRYINQFRLMYKAKKENEHCRLMCSVYIIEPERDDACRAACNIAYNQKLREIIEDK